MLEEKVSAMLAKGNEERFDAMLASGTIDIFGAFFVEGLISDIHWARKTAERHESAEELRHLVEGAHKDRRKIEELWPPALDDVQDDLDYLYAELQRLDPDALDRLAKR